MEYEMDWTLVFFCFWRSRGIMALWVADCTQLYKSSWKLQKKTFADKRSSTFDYFIIFLTNIIYNISTDATAMLRY